MKLRTLLAAGLVVTMTAFIVLVGCGVDSGYRGAGTPGGGTPGLPGGGYNPGSNPGNASQNEQDVFGLVNEHRASIGRAALAWCDGLAALAKAHSNDMCERGFFNHTSDEWTSAGGTYYPGDGPSDRAKAHDDGKGHAGPTHSFEPIVPSPYMWVGENIAMGYSTPQDVMTAWLNSAGHRANIESQGYTHIGVGNCDGCGKHWTQNFGTR